MRRTVSLLLGFVTILALTACGQPAASEKQEQVQPAAQKPEESSESGAEEPGTDEQGAEDDSNAEMEAESSESDSAEKKETEAGTKTLVVYFSCTGTTKLLAESAAEILEADLYEIVPENPYTEADLAYYTNGRADQEQNDPSARPGISGGVGNMEDYGTILLGYPIWHGQAPRIISTFLESYDFSGKTIIPFCTSHSSGIGSSADDLHSLCPESTQWSSGERFAGGTSRDTIEEWLNNIIVRE